jgi:protein-S-isoprenylcysteine O-methyltransferase Ste14
MQRVAFFLFGVLRHAVFFLVFGYMALFVADLLVPITIDRRPGGPVGSVGLAVVINLALLALFAVPHSVMARPAFKRWWTQFVPTPVERSVYVFIANACMILLLAAWQPIGVTLWDVQHPLLRAAIWGIFCGGWVLVPVASLLINHFDLFGTRQVWLHFRNRPYTHLPFRTPLLYKVVRHPLYVGWTTAFWVAPTMTVGHAIFAAVLTAYMLIAIRYEERDLVSAHGERYEQYRREVPGMIPRLPKPRRQAGEAVLVEPA